MLYQVDVSSIMAYIMAPKEDSEIKTMQKASAVTCEVFSKYLREQIMEIIDAEKVNKLFLGNPFLNEPVC
jgi:hypothetical protein